MNPRTQQKAAASKFVTEMLTDDINAQWFKLRNNVPTLNSVWEKEAGMFNNDLWKIARYDVQNTAITRPSTPGFREYEDVLRVALRDIQSGANVQQSLSAAAQKIDREIAKYKG